MAASSTAAASSLSGAWMDRGLLQAAVAGDVESIKHLDPGVLLATTPRGNTCLHVASVHGHGRFCEVAVERNSSLLAAVNADGETPLLSAITSNQVSLASFLLRCCREHRLGEAVLKQDKHGCNALHHAIRSRHETLALDLIEFDLRANKEPVLSRAVNKYNESPMFIAVSRDFTEVLEKLLEVPGSTDGGTYGHNAIHAAVRRGNKDIVTKILGKRPELIREEQRPETGEEESPGLGRGEENKKSTSVKTNKRKDTPSPVRLAVQWNKVDILKVMLEHDWTLGYEVSAAYGDSLLLDAAFRGHVEVAQVLLEHCPDAPYSKADGDWTCLHQAVWNGRTDFVKFILTSKQLHKVVNMRSKSGKTALHYAVQKCNPTMVADLLDHKGVDTTMFDTEYKTAIWKLFDAGDDAKTLNWNEIFMHMMNADPKDRTSTYNVYKAVKNEVMVASRKNVKSLTKTYTTNTSLVAILIATITFAAAFTLPGGYSSDTGSEGLPIMARKLAFQVFLISDTLAMCSSLAVAFICIVARWEDLEFLRHYRTFTKKLMWFAYMATVTAFATGLYTVLAPRLLWMAIAICILPVLLPILTKMLGEWPVLKLRIRLGPTFDSEILDMP